MNDLVGKMYYNNIPSETPEEFVAVFKFFEGNDITLDEFKKETKLSGMGMSDEEWKIYLKLIKPTLDVFDVTNAYTKDEMLEKYPSHKDRIERESIIGK